MIAPQNTSTTLSNTVQLSYRHPGLGYVTVQHPGMGAHTFHPSLKTKSTVEPASSQHRQVARGVR